MESGLILGARKKETTGVSLVVHKVNEILTFHLVFCCHWSCRYKSIHLQLDQRVSAILDCAFFVCFVLAHVTHTNRLSRVSDLHSHAILSIML